MLYNKCNDCRIVFDIEFFIDDFIVTDSFESESFELCCLYDSFFDFSSFNTHIHLFYFVLISHHHCTIVEKTMIQE